LPSPATQFAIGHTPKPVNLLRDARELEQLVMEKARTPKLDADSLASLVRSFVALLDGIRELRGIPKAGQLRPDLDPEQLLKALKRARERKPFELTAGKVTFTEGPANDEPITKSKLDTKAKSKVKLDKPEKEQPTTPEDTKGISFDAPGGVDGVGGGGAQEKTAI
jgi:hypothetical protein